MAVFMRNGATYGGGGVDINDTTTSTTKVWSSSKVSAELSAKANSADVPTKAQITNPNLLDNPWFTINQRGQSSYTGLNNVYFLDRWKVDGDMTEYTFSPTSNGLEISCVGTPTYNRFFVQKIEDNVLEEEKTYTISVLIKSNVSTKATFQVRNNGSFVFGSDSSFNVTTGWQVVSFTGTMPSSLSNVAVRIYPNYSKVANATVYIRAVKLERGSISTLALDTAPNYATELLKCQRYFVRYLSGQGAIFPVAFGQVATSTSFRCAITVPVEMRTTPTISVTGLENMRVYANGANNAPSALTVHSIMGNQVRLLATTSNLTQNHLGSLCMSTATDCIDLSADL